MGISVLQKYPCNCNCAGMQSHFDSRLQEENQICILFLVDSIFKAWWLLQFVSWARHMWLNEKKKPGSTFKCLTWHCFLLHKVVAFCERSKGPDFSFRPSNFESCAQLIGASKSFFYRRSVHGGLTLKVNTANQYLCFVHVLINCGVTKSLRNNP